MYVRVNSYEKYAENQYHIELSCGHSADIYHAVPYPPTEYDCQRCKRPSAAGARSKRDARPSIAPKAVHAAPTSMTHMTIDEHLIHQSVNRPQQLIGCDRELLVTAAIVCAVGALALGAIWGIVLCLILWFVSVAALQRMGKADPLMRQVYMRHVRYKPYYPAKAGLYSRSPVLPPFWTK
jgi:type IV secretion system protein VirB3